MSYLFLNGEDKELNKKRDELEKQKSEYKEMLMQMIDTKFKKDDSETVYNLFTPKQSEVLKKLFKGFAVEMYAELCDTTDIQIDARNKANKEAVERIGKELGRPIKAEEWQYDGFAQFDKDKKQKCDLCGKISLQNTHYIINKVTKNTLQFGCSCAGKFLHLPETTLRNLKTVQAQTLSDLKILAYVRSQKEEKKYLYLACGSIGEIAVTEGIQGVKDLMPFRVEWVDEDNIKGDKEKDEYIVVFGKTFTEKRSMNWIKAHIATCINADLDTKYYETTEDRKLIPLATLKSDKKIVKLTFLLESAIICLENQLAIPLHLANKINRLLNAMAKLHHLDYSKYIDELMMSDILQQSSLLKSMFSDYIVNYLESTATKKAIPRNEEMAIWGIRGIKSFYTTVMRWQALLLKIKFIQGVLKLEKVNYFNCTNSGINREIKGYLESSKNLNSEDIIKYCDDIIKIFLSKRKVLKDEKALELGYSQYSLNGIDVKLRTSATQENETSVALIIPFLPYNIGVIYKKFGDYLGRTITQELSQIYKMLINPFLLAEDDETALRYLLCFKLRYMKDEETIKNGFKSSFYFRYFKIENEEDLKKFLKHYTELDEEIVKEYSKKYLKNIVEFRKSIKELGKIMLEIYKGVKDIGYSSYYTTYSEMKKIVSSDFESIIEKQKEKGMLDYAIEYAQLFDKNRGTNKVQEWLGNITNVTAIENKALNVLGNFKIMKPYSEMLEDIMSDDEAIKQKDQALKAKEKREAEFRKKVDMLIEKGVKQDIYSLLVNLDSNYHEEYYEDIGIKDDTGFNLIQKANICYNHKDMEKLKSEYRDAIISIKSGYRMNKESNANRVNKVYATLIEGKYDINEILNNVDKYTDVSSCIEYLKQLPDYNKVVSTLEKSMFNVIQSKNSLLSSQLETLQEVCKKLGVDLDETKLKIVEEIPSESDIKAFTKYLMSKSQFKKLNTIAQGVVKTVNSKGTVTENQAFWISKACKELNIPFDKSKVTIKAVEAVKNSDELIKIAEDITKHSGFDSLSEKERSIINTIVKNKKISEKQAYWVKKIKDSLGL